VSRHAFTVFVTGDGARGQRTVGLLRALCDRHLGDDYDLTIVDVLVDTSLAERFNVVATPTVIRTSPPPALRALGDLGDADRAATALGLGPPVGRATDNGRRPAPDDDRDGR
jgi:circadian clock protein KaiB